MSNPLRTASCPTDAPPLPWRAKSLTPKNKAASVPKTDCFRDAASVMPMFARICRRPFTRRRSLAAELPACSFPLPGYDFKTLTPLIHGVFFLRLHHESLTQHRHASRLVVASRAAACLLASPPCGSFSALLWCPPGTRFPSVLSLPFLGITQNRSRARPHSEFEIEGEPLNGTSPP